LQHYIRRELIGGIFGVPEGRNIQQIEYCMPELVGNDVEELPIQCIDRCDACRRRLLGDALPDLVQVLVANGSVLT